ncbi:hypothetical protein BBJ28_00015769 [Nothophytophthora sp. Chile5]|nr:hypothetical protein BBJ28_00015769 [Nothophytophthora sp. Chile5]
MSDMDPKSTRAQFTKVVTPGDSTEVPYAVKVNHLPSPAGAMDLDTPRTMDVVRGDGIPSGAWAAGLFDCFQHCVPNCLMVTFCPCVALAQVSARLGVASFGLALGVLLLLMVVELVMFIFIWTSESHSISSEDEGYYNYGWQHHGHSSSSSSDTTVNGTFVAITLLVQVLVFLFIWQLRAKARSWFQLPGNVMTDCLSSWFCPCCTVAQLATHLPAIAPNALKEDEPNSSLQKYTFFLSAAPRVQVLLDRSLPKSQPIPTMADCQKPPQTTWAYAGPVHTAVYVEHADGQPIASGQVRPANIDEQGLMVGAWSADFWGCCDFCVPNCWMATCCPCVTLAQISARLGVAPFTRTLVVFFVLVLAHVIAELYPTFTTSSRTQTSNTSYGWRDSRDNSLATSTDNDDSGRSVLTTVVRAIIFVYVWYLRQTTRQRFHIPGGALGDCWASLCCSCCTMAQIATHIRSYKPGSCSFAAPDILPPYPGTLETS